jgi:hypothetical protein
MDTIKAFLEKKVSIKIWHLAAGAGIIWLATKASEANAAKKTGSMSAFSSQGK